MDLIFVVEIIRFFESKIRRYGDVVLNLLISN